LELNKQNTDIDFDAISLDVYQVDIEETGKKGDSTPQWKKLNERQSQAIIEYINTVPEESQIRTLADLIVSSMGRMEQFADSDLRRYLKRVIEDMSIAVRSEVKSNPFNYAQKIKKHIENLAERTSEAVFTKWIDTDKVFLKDSYELPNHITPTDSSDTITKSLYIAEDSMNNFEKDFITEVASLD
jgi:type III restriction enzyme